MFKEQVSYTVTLFLCSPGIHAPVRDSRPDPLFLNTSGEDILHQDGPVRSYSMVGLGLQSAPKNHMFGLIGAWVVFGATLSLGGALASFGFERVVVLSSAQLQNLAESPSSLQRVASRFPVDRRARLHARRCALLRTLTLDGCAFGTRTRKIYGHELQCLERAVFGTTLWLRLEQSGTTFVFARSSLSQLAAQV